MAENNDPAAGETSGADNQPPSQRKIFGSKRLANPVPPERPELEEKLASLVDSVKVLQSQIASDSSADAHTDIDPRDGNARRYKRLQRSVDEPAETGGETPADETALGNEVSQNSKIAWPRLSRPAEGPPGAGRNTASLAQRYPFLVWVVVNVAGFALILAGYWLGQSAGNDDEKAEPAEPATDTRIPAANSLTRMGVNDRALEAANLALNAEKNGDLKTARQTYEQAVNQVVRLPGSEYRLAMLDIQRQDFAAADIHLERSLAQGEMMAACYMVNAAFAGTKGNYTEAARQLALAVRVEPFSAKYYFCWGEALRRSGKPQAGIDALEQALRRPASPRDVDLFNFKLRLAKAELEHDEAFNAELAGHLARQPVDGDWLLLAAAQDLAKAAYPAAAAHLQQAARVLSPEIYQLWAQDYVFQGYANKPQIAPLLPAASPASADPSAWLAEEADPAVWQPFAPSP